MYNFFFLMLNLNTKLVSFHWLSISLNKSKTVLSLSDKKSDTIFIYLMSTMVIQLFKMKQSIKYIKNKK